MRGPHPLAPRDRRALGIALAATALLLAWRFALLPYLGAMGAARAELAAERALLGRELQAIAGAGSYPAAWDTGAARLLRAAPRLMGGASDGAAGAALAGYLQSAAAGSRVLLVQVEPLPSQDAGQGLTALGARLSGESDLEGLLGFLLALETGPKLLRIEQLQVDAAAARAAAPGAETLAFQLAVAGFTLGSGPGARPGAARAAAVEAP